MRRLSGSSPAAGRCHPGNSHSAAATPDSGSEPDTGRGAPLIAPADRARCTVAKPQRPRYGPHAFGGRETPPYLAVPRRPIQRRAGRQVMPPIPAGAGDGLVLVAFLWPLAVICPGAGGMAGLRLSAPFYRVGTGGEKTRPLRTSLGSARGRYPVPEGVRLWTSCGRRSQRS